MKVYDDDDATICNYKLYDATACKKIISRLMIKCVNCDRRRNAPYKIDLYNLCRFGEK